MCGVEAEKELLPGQRMPRQTTGPARVCVRVCVCVCVCVDPLEPVVWGSCEQGQRLIV